MVLTPSTLGRNWIFFAIHAMLLCVLLRSPVQGAISDDFDTTIAPILSAHCLECHRGSGAEAGLDLSVNALAMDGGESGAAIVPGQLDSSLLWEKVESGEMPPEHELSGNEKTLLREWIERGAPWGTDPIDPFQFSNSRRAGYDWWALQPIQQSLLPINERDEWSLNELDQFIFAGLSDAKLVPSPRADPRTLVRRIHFDLVGLPPTPEAVRKFVSSPTQQEWEALVDELLGTEDYGERWAQHWLDVVRFAETHGYEYNAPRNDAWPYRDWVIQSLNRDMPYDEFARMQIAGDLIKPGTKEGAAATGFLVAGVHNTVLGQSDAMKRAGRHEELEEIAGTTAQTFLGLTVNCARCHDHKFDPISNQEYYEFIAALDGVNHGSTTIFVNPDPSLRRELTIKKDELTREFYDRVQQRVGRLSNSANVVTLVEPIAANDRGETYSISFQASPTVWADPSQVTTEADSLWISLLSPDGSELSRKNIQPGIWADVENQQDFRLFSFDYVGDGSGDVKIRIGSDPPELRFGGAIDDLVVRDSNGNVVFSDDFNALGNQKNLGKQAHTGLTVFWGLESDLWTSTGINTIHAVEYEPDNFALQIFSGWIDVELRAETDEETSIQNQIKAIDRELAGTSMFSVVSRDPAPMRILNRGDPKLVGDEVSPGGLSAIVGLDPDFKLASDATDLDRRRHLAEWMTHPSNAPFHRVIVNRVWHYHFGKGLVETPNDFGFNGGRPSHPELLDWLAGWFRDHDYSLKALHKLIVTSATYQQSSIVAHNARGEFAQSVDKDNRLIWRQNPRRIDAESFRDGLLYIAGELNPQRFGPGYRDTRVETIGAAFYYRSIDPVGLEFNRRTIYRFHARGERSALLESFDCPDPSTTAPRRTVTTTPSQLLSQWNDAFVLRMATSLANRIERESASLGTDQVIETHVRKAWWLVLAREPTDDELAQSSELVRKHGLELLCRVLFNSNETILID